MRVIGIDPGPEKSGLVHIEDGKILAADWDNKQLAVSLPEWVVPVAIEDFTPYGKSLGHESMTTIKWIGVFAWQCRQSPGGEPLVIPRPEIKLHLCGIRTAKDADVRDALIHRFGPGKEKAIGTKKNPGPLYGVTGHMWSALAVAVTAMDRLTGRD